MKRKLNKHDLRYHRKLKRFIDLQLKEWNISNNDRKRHHHTMSHKLAAKLRFKEFQEIHKKRGVL